MAVIGVLGLQGDYEAHQEMLREIGAEWRDVRRAAELEMVDALVIPGGESTTMLRLIHREGLWDALARFGAEKPVFGTCAGAILMATDVSHPQQESFALMDIGVVRNGYGRQLDSRIVALEPEPTAKAELGEQVEAVFIRAPIISRVGEGVETLVRYNGDAVLVRQGKHLAAAYHPELTTDPRVHAYFVRTVAAGMAQGVASAG